MKKTVRCSVAAVIRGSTEESFLVVRRPPDDDHLPDIWGLPAVTLRPGELPEAGLRRVGREKLGVTLEPTRFIGISHTDRGEYELILMDIEAGIVSGDPDVHRATTDATRYVELGWAEEPDILVEAATQGSLCSQILLDHYGFPY